MYFELNEYGIVYHRILLDNDKNQSGIQFDALLWDIRELIEQSRALYKKCEYLGNIEVIAQLRDVHNKRLIDPDLTATGHDGPVCSDSEVQATIQCMPRDFENTESRRGIVEDLICQLLWAFNIPIENERVRERVRQRIAQNI